MSDASAHRIFIHRSWLEVLGHPVRLEILSMLLEAELASATELAELLPAVSPRSLRRQLETLVTLGLVHAETGESDGMTNGRPATRFFLDADVDEAIADLFDLVNLPLRPWS